MDFWLCKWMKVASGRFLQGPWTVPWLAQPLFWRAPSSSLQSRRHISSETSLSPWYLWLYTHVHKQRSSVFCLITVYFSIQQLSKNYLFFVLPFVILWYNFQLFIIHSLHLKKSTPTYNFLIPQCVCCHFSVLWHFPIPRLSTSCDSYWMLGSLSCPGTPLNYCSLHLSTSRLKTLHRDSFTQFFFFFFVDHKYKLTTESQS